MSNVRIVIADDSEDIRVFLAENVLAPEGYQVYVAQNGEEALELVREFEPALVITDHLMPRMSGLELIRGLRREFRQIPAILISGESSEMLVLEALRAGARDFYNKPFDTLQLLDGIRRLIEEDHAHSRNSTSPSPAAGNTAKLEKRVRELETLARVGRTVTALLDLDEVLTTVVDAALRLTKAEEGSLLLLDEKTGELHMVASKNIDEEYARAFRLKVNDSLAGQVISAGKPILLDEKTLHKITTAYLVHSLIYVPLLVRGRPIGVLGVNNRSQGRDLLEQDLLVLNAMADYAAIAIDNARLFAATEAERSKLEALLTQTEDGVLVVNEDNEILMVNGKAREALGGEAVTPGAPAEESIKLERMLGLLTTSGNLPRRDEIETNDGRVFNAQRTVISGVGQMIVMQDITRLKELDRIKSEFVTTVSHDLRSPLTAILGYVELIERAGAINERQSEYVRRIKQSVDRIGNLVNDLLDLGRIEAGLDVSKEDVSIDILLRTAVEGIRGAAETKGLSLHYTVADGLPLATGDPIRLRQAFVNLLENAVKYTPAGGAVEAEASVDGEQILVRIRDNGPGIPLADQPYLFDKFYRGSNVTADQQGSGLGLSIVKSIVDNHEGRIWVDSTINSGTMFTIVLPARMQPKPV